ncbi:[Fe-Fe] hydrogenase large subunit C-terminal domain-containing protein [Natranaerobius thermophilus]|uniref:Fe-S cluster domain protein n=1 Tax=Natranaerobius thermophilus (strain ATCC BAA-1301 / DSM 18059 / JW/NM-WN-LF) TaxID=457570 RepID=B2A3R6_NATTJ|nr:[Fe-Fe] hydrogenase large subunit C-terminal domain-containing protein [Natranaerobius thermophilus]ACB83692.1 Fe-S cluster domain protein [Natranaerobius thermophilus JW/NM-WN-LF]
MKPYYHSVRLKEESCIGCVHCLKFCPTQAIRIKGGRAEILKERCIDCGGCIQICPNNAKIAESDNISQIDNFQHKVAVVPPSVLVQFPKDVLPKEVFRAFLDLGFDKVFSISLGGEWYSYEVNKILNSNFSKKPLISTHCPAIVRLIQVKFPELVGNLVPVDTPLDITGDIAREYLKNQLNLDDEDIGIFLISMCSARVTAVKSPEGRPFSSLNGVLSLIDIYSQLLKSVKATNSEEEQISNNRKNLDGAIYPPELGIGVGHDVTGCDQTGIESNDCLSISGINNVMDVLEEIELGKISELDYIELHSCYGGCVGGVLNVENPFVSKVRMNKIINEMEKDSSYLDGVTQSLPKSFNIRKINIQPRPLEGLSNSISQSVKKLSEIEKLLNCLPQLDCGACGSPSCRSLAEDVVLQRADMKDCVFYLLDNVASLTQEAYTMAKGIPHVLKMRHKGLYNFRKD